MNTNEFIEEKVKHSYEENNYTDVFRSRCVTDFEKSMFDKALCHLPLQPEVLDLGCGNGYPYDTYLIQKGCTLTGIDFCHKHIVEAKVNNPSASYICDNIKSYLNTNVMFDMVMALYSILHIPRNEHEAIFRSIYSKVRRGGCFLITLRNEDSGELKYKDNFCGSDMYWSYFDYATYEKMLKNIGFEIIGLEDEQKYGSKEQHNWVLLKKT